MRSHKRREELHANVSCTVPGVHVLPLQAVSKVCNTCHTLWLAVRVTWDKSTHPGNALSRVSGRLTDAPGRLSSAQPRRRVTVCADSGDGESSAKQAPKQRREQGGQEPPATTSMSGSARVKPGTVVTSAGGDDDIVTRFLNAAPLIPPDPPGACERAVFEDLLSHCAGPRRRQVTSADTWPLSESRTRGRAR